MGYIKGKNVTINYGTIIGNNVIIGDDVYIDYNCIIRDNVIIKDGTYIGSRCILGEYTADFYKSKKCGYHPLIIGENSIISSGTVIYGDTIIDNDFYTGHNVTVRENCRISDCVTIETKSDIQHDCEIGKYTNINNGCFLGEESKVEAYVKLLPGVVLTNDPTPPSNNIMAVKLEKLSTVAAGGIILPNIIVGMESYVAEGAVVTKDVHSNTLVEGNPAKVLSTYRNKNDWSLLE